MGNQMVVTNTVRGLAPGDAADVLQAVVARLQSKASRGSQLAEWLRPLLLSHAAHFASLPGILLKAHPPDLVVKYMAFYGRSHHCGYGYQKGLLLLIKGSKLRNMPDLGALWVQFEKS